MGKFTQISADIRRDDGGVLSAEEKRFALACFDEIAHPLVTFDDDDEVSIYYDDTSFYTGDYAEHAALKACSEFPHLLFRIQVDYGLEDEDYCALIHGDETERCAKIVTYTQPKNIMWPGDW